MIIDKELYNRNEKYFLKIFRYYMKLRKEKKINKKLEKKIKDKIHLMSCWLLINTQDQYKDNNEVSKARKKIAFTSLYNYK